MSDMWVILSFISALCLGLYDLAKKSSVRDNAVPMVLLLNVLTGAAIYFPIIVWSGWIHPLDAAGHGLLFAKSALVGASWTLAFFALKHLPISIAAPIRATSPLWTILIAVLMMGESPAPIQWLGIAIILGAFAYFSRTGRSEGINFRRNPWVGLMIVATLLGATSSIYDKFLLQNCGYAPVTVQAWFSIYLCPVMLPLAVHWGVRGRKSKPFQFRWTIPAIAVCLLIADILYFTAIACDDAMVSVISPVRRTSVIIPFAFGILVLAEKNWKPKLLSILLMLIGVVLVGVNSLAAK
jgi:transporter family protein